MDATLHFVCGIHFGLFRMHRYTALSHFKGHAMEGLGEAIKSYFIGFRSSKGDGWIHSGCTGLTGAFRQKAVRFSGSCKRNVLADAIPDNLPDYIKIAIQALVNSAKS